MKHIFFTVLVILSSCMSSDRPKDLIEKEKMVELLTEIHILEAKINHVPVKPYDSTQLIYDHYEKLLFQDHGITQHQYERSFNYYMEHLDEFEKIYEMVTDSLLKLKTIHQ